MRHFRHGITAKKIPVTPFLTMKDVSIAGWEGSNYGCLENIHTLKNSPVLMKAKFLLILSVIYFNLILYMEINCKKNIQKFIN